jgi:hypothetical protein
MAGRSAHFQLRANCREKSGHGTYVAWMISSSEDREAQAIDGGMIVMRECITVVHLRGNRP